MDLPLAGGTWLRPAPWTRDRLLESQAPGPPALSVLVDCSTSGELAARYPDMFDAGAAGGDGQQEGQQQHPGLLPGAAPALVEAGPAALYEANVGLACPSSTR